MKEYNVAILGASGLVGREMLKILIDRKFPFKELRLLASSKSAGTTIEIDNKSYVVEETKEESFTDINIVLASAGAEVSRIFAPLAVKRGAIVIDNTSAFRMDQDVPLVVPEVNPEDLKKHKGIISNPNCSTIQLVVVLKPLHNFIPIKRVIVSTYQAVSGAGKKALEELKSQIQSPEYPAQVFKKQIAFNLIPQIDVFLHNDYTKEEMKMTNETKKIMRNENINVVATAVRVPVITGHSESVNIEFEKPFPPDKAREILKGCKGITVIDKPHEYIFPTPKEVEGTDDVYVGRIRRDISHPNCLNMWIVSDNLRKGAALNAVQIAEKLVEMNLV